MRKNRLFLDNCLSEDSDEVIKGRGKNIIPPPKKESLWRQYLQKFKDPLIIVLLVVFFFSVIVSLYEIIQLGQGPKMLLEPLGVFLALLLATGVAFIFELKADKEFEILNKVKDQRQVKVYRYTKKDKKSVLKIREITKQDVCVGDYVYLEAGDEVPADGIIDEANSLIVDESNFTGEPYTNKSTSNEFSDKESTFPTNKLLRGSTIVDGTAIYHVEQVGMDTIEGKGVAKVYEGKEVQTPLNQQLDKLGTAISRISFIFAILIVLGRLIYFFFFDGNTANHDFVSILEFTLASIMLAVTLIVVAVPEGLPMSVTVSLALSMRSMLKEKNLVRKLHACETMGATTVICTDKTGTLTQNKMTVVENIIFGEESRERTYLNIALNSTAELLINEDEKGKIVGNPTEGALLRWLKELGIDYFNIRKDSDSIDIIEPFSPDKKYMKSEAAVEGRVYRFIKGAPEIIIEMCKSLGDKESIVYDDLIRYQEKAMRTLAFASQEFAGGEWSEISLDAIVGIADPIRTDVKEAIDDCTQKAGVRVIIVTGDCPGTANEIGRQIGLISEDENPQITTGEMFANMSDEEATELIKDPNFKMISRAKPDDKARLVTLLQKQNEVVAVTGDGTNDAPALSKAQVGLSMGDGTARAKEASDITIIDNSFHSIVRAIVWGRSLYLNIRRFIIFQMTINVCACLVVLFGTVTGVDSPLTVTQMLWVNLIMDTFAAMALSSLPPDRKVLCEKPRDSKSFIINGKMAKMILLFGGFFFVLLFGLWQFLWHNDLDPNVGVSALYSFDSFIEAFKGLFNFTKTKVHISSYESGVFFTFFVMLQFWNLFNARYFATGRSLLEDLLSFFSKPKEVLGTYSKGFILILFVIIIGQIAIVNFAGELFNVSPLCLRDWLWIIVGTSPILILADIYRFVKSKLKRYDSK